MKIPILLTLAFLIQSPSVFAGGGKAMDCDECADTYCNGDKTCEACEPICGKNKGEGVAPVPGIVTWTCECDDGSGDGGTSQGDSKAEAIKNCKAANHGHGKVFSCSKDSFQDAAAIVPESVQWFCECDDGSGDGGTSDGLTKAEAIRNCGSVHGGPGKVSGCYKQKVSGPLNEALAPVPGTPGGWWQCECDDGSHDGGFSQGTTKAEAIAACKKANGEKGKVFSCNKD